MRDSQVLTFSCAGDRLLGVLDPGQPGARRGVVVIVGGPQYRVGSHRQFTLLARTLAAAGVPVLRFDARGMGDAEGALHEFEHTADDIRAAIDALQSALPSVEEVVLWGLCDGASAAMMYAAYDPRVSGMVVLNPWVRTAEGLAKTTLKHYYRARLLDRTFWAKLFSGKFHLRKALHSLLGLVRQARASGTQTRTTSVLPFPERMLAGLEQFDGRVLVILSGADLTAREFEDTVAASPAWQRRLAAPGVARQRLPAADHTFSRRQWRDQVAGWTLDWMSSW